MAHPLHSTLKMRTIAPFIAMAALTTGCAHLPKTGTAANGQALFVDVNTENIQYVGKVKAGETVLKDANGNVVGTAESYEDKLMSYNITTWQTFQGEDKLDDEDFFRIAGDTQAADQIHDGRDRAVSLNRAGFVVLGVGLAAAIAGLVIRSAAAAPVNPDAPYLGTTPNAAGTLIASGGFVVALIGGSLIFYGNAAAKREHPLDDPRRAKRDERKYNKEKGLKPISGEERHKKSSDDE